MDEVFIGCPGCGHMDNKCWLKSNKGKIKVECADCGKTILADYEIKIDVKNIRLKRVENELNN